MAVDQFDRMIEISVAGLEPADRSLPELSLFLASPRISEDHRQRHLAFAEIVAAILAHGGGIGIVIQRVIDQLECNPEVAAVFVERLLLFVAAFGDDRRDTASGGEQRGGLRADDVQIALFAGIDLALRGQLVDLAFGNDRRGSREDLEHLEAAVLGHQLERTAEEEIAHQHGRGIAVDDVGGRLAAAKIASIDDIVVQQGRGVNELYRRGQLVMPVAAVADQFRPRERQHRAQPLASSRDQMPRKRRNQRHLALHPVEDDLVDLVHARSGESQHRLDRSFGLLARQCNYVGRHFGLAMVCASFLGKRRFLVSLPACPTHPRPTRFSPAFARASTISMPR